MEKKHLKRFGIEGSKGALTYAHIDDTRKPKLTLIHLNKIKKFRAMHDIEMLKREEVLTAMYGQGGEEGGSDDGMF